MLTVPPSVRIYVCGQFTDMRRSFDGLSAMARDIVRQDPLSGHLFVFCNRRADRVKVLWWDRSGFALWYKRLEEGQFRFPQGEASAYEMEAAELALVLEGIELVSPDVYFYELGDVKIYGPGEQGAQGRALLFDRQAEAVQAAFPWGPRRAGLGETREGTRRDYTSVTCARASARGDSAVAGRKRRDGSVSSQACRRRRRGWVQEGACDQGVGLASRGSRTVGDSRGRFGSSAKRGSIIRRSA